MRHLRVLYTLMAFTAAVVTQSRIEMARTCRTNAKIEAICSGGITLCLHGASLAQMDLIHLNYYPW
jgi:hypothetical protein